MTAGARDAPLVRIALIEPEIPQNTGCIARLTAGFGLPLHIVGEPRFSLSDHAVRRAGLDYWPLVELHRHPTIWDLLETAGNPRLLPLSARGRTPLRRARFRPGDVLCFGGESSGLPPEILRDFGALSIRIEQEGPIRSLNVATAVGIVAWEALRQLSEDEAEGSRR